MQAAISRAVEAALASRPQPQAEPRQPQKPPEPEDPLPGLSDDDLIDARTVRQLVQRQSQQQQQMTGALEYLYNTSIGNLEQNSRILNPELWDKYGDEIKKEIDRLKQNKVVTADDFDNVLQTVKGRHIEDFIQEGVKKYLESAPPTDVQQGVSATDSDIRIPDDTEIPDSYKRALVAAYGDLNSGLQGIRDMVRIRREWGEVNLTFDDVLKEIASGSSIIDPMKGTVSNIDLTAGAKKLNG